MYININALFRKKKKDNYKQNQKNTFYLFFIHVIIFEICLPKLRLIREYLHGNKSIFLLKSVCRSLGVIFPEFLVRFNNPLKP